MSDWNTGRGTLEQFKLFHDLHLVTLQLVNVSRSSVTPGLPYLHLLCGSRYWSTSNYSRRDFLVLVRLSCDHKKEKAPSYRVLGTNSVLQWNHALKLIPMFSVILWKYASFYLVSMLREHFFSSSNVFNVNLKRRHWPFTDAYSTWCWIKNPGFSTL